MNKSKIQKVFEHIEKRKNYKGLSYVPSKAFIPRSWLLIVRCSTLLAFHREFDEKELCKG